jgi:hypothetical protein
LPAGTGGSENYTVGQVRELILRGIPAQVVTVGLGDKDGRNEFIDIPFLSLRKTAQISDLDGIVVFVNEATAVTTKEPAFVIMHIPPPGKNRLSAIKETLRGRTLIATRNMPLNCGPTIQVELVMTCILPIPLLSHVLLRKYDYPMLLSL